ncbi:MAG TPA: hypothetical protein VGF75_02945 [Candidatus Saccharimonadales bacterium]|jgi:hypothetical protein
MSKTQNVDPFTFLARKSAGRYTYAFGIGGNLKEGETVGAKQSFDPFSIFIVTRITCNSPTAGSIQILEGPNELLHAITEIKEYATNIQNMAIQRINLLNIKVIKITEPAPLIVRFEGDLFPAGLVD